VPSLLRMTEWLSSRDIADPRCVLSPTLKIYLLSPDPDNNPLLPPMLVEAIICSPTPSYPYHIAAKRYSVGHDGGVEEQRCCGPDKDLTLIFLHSTSFPKEIWEPTIEDLLHRQNLREPRIREAYAIDCPNHGVAAVLNDGLLGDCAGMMTSCISPR